MIAADRFVVKDVLMNSILIEALDDMAALAREVPQRTSVKSTGTKSRWTRGEAEPWAF